MGGGEADWNALQISGEKEGLTHLQPPTHSQVLASGHQDSNGAF